jgi:hypothetical protein
MFKPNLQGKKERSLIKVYSKAIVLFVLFCSFFIFYSEIQAKLPPARILLQATIADGDELLEGRRRVIVKLYEDETPTNWKEIHKNVVFTEGICTLNLGEHIPFTQKDLDVSTPNFRLVIEGEELPVPLSSVPYAIRAAYAEEVPLDMTFSNIIVSKNILIGDLSKLTPLIEDPSYTIFGEKIPSLSSTLLVLGQSFIEDKFAVSTNFIVTGNRVGIRNLDPQYELDVIGTINASALRIGGIEYSSKAGDIKISQIMNITTENGNFMVANGTSWEGLASSNVRSLLKLAPEDTVNFTKLGIDVDSPAGVFHIRSTDNIITAYSPVAYKGDSLVVSNNRVGIGLSLPVATLHVSGNYPLHVGTGGSPNALVVHPSGNIGIQTMNPDSNFALHIIGNLKVEGAIDTDAGLNADNDWSIKSGLVYNDIPNMRIGIGTDSPSGNFHIQSISNASYTGDTFVVTNNRIGIGTTDPTANLHIRPQEQFPWHILYVENEAEEPILILRQTGKVGIGITDPESPFHIVVDETDALSVTKNAVGIGTSRPQSFLELTASNSITTDLLHVSKSDGSSYLTKFIIQNDGDIAIGTDNPKGYFHILREGKDALVVTKDGVGIGTTEPIANLDIYEPGVPTRPLFIIRNETETRFVVSGNGWLAVNTANPQGALHVKTAKNTAPSVYLDTLIVTNNSIGIGTANPVAKLDLVGSFPLVVSTYLTPNALVVSSNGYVGIGTLNPDEALVVSGNLRITGGLLSAESGFVQLPRAKDSWLTNEWAGVLYQTNGEGSAYPFNGNGNLIIQANSQASKDVIIAIGAPQPQPVLVVNEELRVGIGTIAPSGDLHVISSGEDTLVITGNRIGVGTTAPDGLFQIGENLFVATKNAIAIGTSDPLHYKFRINGNLLVDGGVYQGNGEAAELSDSDWVQDNVNHKIYNANDKVGIGTSAPLGAFHVVTTADGKLHNSIYADNGNVVIGTANALGYFHVYTEALPNAIIVTDNGYIGIATADPKYNLDIAGTLNAIDIRIGGVSIKDFDSPENGVLLVATGDRWEILDIDESRNAIQLGTREDFSVTHNQIGIHNTDPQADLHISGNYNTVAFRADAAGSLGTGNIILDGNGRVGIGTLSPSGRFHVMSKLGTAYETSLIVSGNRVGIGTDTPGDLLNLQFNGSNYENYLGMKITNEFGGSASYTPKAGMNFFFEDGTKSAKIIASMQDKAKYPGGWVSGPTYIDLKFITNDQTRMIIKENGRVGIGTEEPSGNLHILENALTSLIVTNNMLGVGTLNPKGQVNFYSGNTDVLIVTGNRFLVTGNFEIGNQRVTVTENNEGKLALCIGSVPDTITLGSYDMYVDGKVFFKSFAAGSTEQDQDWTYDVTDNVMKTTLFVGMGQFATNSEINAPLLVKSNSIKALIVTQNRLGVGNFEDPQASLEVRPKSGDSPLRITGIGASPPTYLVVTENGYVGVGKENPSYTMEIIGSLNVSEGIMYNGDKVATETLGLWELARLATADGNIIYATANHWAVGNENIARDIIGFGPSDTPTLNKLGIQRAAIPVGDLHIGDDSNSTLFVDVDGDAANGGKVGVGTMTPAGQLHIRSYLADGGQGATDALVVTNNRVGIVTANPTHTLTVQGDIYGENIYVENLKKANGDRVPLVSIDPTSKVAVNAIIRDENLGFFTKLGDSCEPTTADDILVYVNGSWTRQQPGYILNSSTLSLGPESDARFRRLGLYFENKNTGTGNDGDLEVYRYDDGALTHHVVELIVTGNKVGIGVIEPDAALHIMPLADEFISPLRITSSNASTVFMVVTRNGYVGIATDAPNYELDVAGIINATDMKINGDSVATRTVSLYDISLLATDNKNIIYSDGATWQVASENVARAILDLGISNRPAFEALGLGGQLVPEGPLHISNTLLVTDNRLGVYVFSEPSANLHVSANTGDVPFLVSVTSKKNSLIVTKNGYVGISTDDPSYDLDVDGTINATTILLNGLPVNKTTEGLDALANLATDNLNIIYSNGTNWMVASNNAARIVLGLGTSDSPTFNQIGAGSLLTTAPQGDLHVGVSSLIVTNNRVGIGTLTPTGDFHVKSGAGTYAFVVKDNKIGIGTDDPSDTLEVIGNISLADNEITNIRAIQFKDFDDGNSGTDNKYRLIARNEALQVPSGGMVVGYSGIDWPAISSGDMLVSNSLGVGVTNPQAVLHTTENFKVSLGSRLKAFVVRDFQDDNIIASIDGKLYVEGLSIGGSAVAANTDELEDLSTLSGDPGNFIIGNGNVGSEWWKVASGNVVKHLLGIGDEDRPTLSVLGLAINSAPIGDLQVGANTLFVTGNFVGIGTTAPKGALHILSSEQDAFIVTQDSIAIGDFDIGSGLLSLGASLNVINKHGSYIASFNNDLGANGHGIYISGGDGTEGAYQAITFANSTDADQTYIGHYDGNLGIGTTEPQSALQVNGTVATIAIIKRDSSGDNVAMKFENDESAFYIGLNQNEGFSVATGQDLGGSAVLTVTDNMVGIGTTQPIGQLHIKDSTGTSLITISNSVGIGIASEAPAATLNVISAQDDYVARFEHSNNTTEAKGILISGGTDAIGEYKAISFTDGDDGNEAFIGYKESNLGIGLTKPSANLHVTGNIPLQISTDEYRYALVVTTNGRVGIATANPSVEFEVAGTINALALTMENKTLYEYFLPADYDPDWIMDYVENISGTTFTGTWLSGGNWGVPRFSPTDAGTKIGTENSNITVDIPPGARTAYISFRAEKTYGGYIEVYTKSSDTGSAPNPVFQRRISTYQPNYANQSSFEAGNIVAVLATGLEACESLSLTVKKGRLYFTGIAFTREKNKGGGSTGYVHWDNLQDKPFASDGSLTLDSFLGAGSADAPNGELHIKSLRLNGSTPINTLLVTQNSVVVGDITIVADPPLSLGASLNVNSGSEYIASFNNTNNRHGIFISGGADNSGGYQAITFAPGNPELVNPSVVTESIWYKNGNIAIGTSNIQAKFQVQGSSPFIAGTETSPNIFIIDTTGNVGIGIANGIPSATMHIVNTHYFPGLFFEDSSVAAADLTWKSGQDLNIGTWDNGSNLSNSTFSQKMVIESGGNVGIGHTNPGAILHVTGNNTVLQVSAGNNPTALTVLEEGSGASSVAKVYIGEDISAYDSDQALNVSGNINISNYLGDTSIILTRMLSDTDDQNSVALSNMNGVMSFSINGNTLPIEITTSNAHSDRLSLSVNKTGNKDAELYIASATDVSALIVAKHDKVGIGLDDPMSTLEIYSISTPSIRFSNEASPVAKFTMGVDSADSHKFKIGTTDLETGTSLTIDSGKVGIGVTAPNTMLELGHATAPALTFDVAGTDEFTMGVENNIFKIGTANISDTVLSISDATLGAGKVGIGTISPASTFEVNGSVSYAVISILNNGYNFTSAANSDKVHTLLLNNGSTETVNLPDAASFPGRILVIKSIGNGNVTINRSGSDTIDGDTSKTLVTQYDSITLQAFGTNWNILSWYIVP